jgi:arsenite transporter
LPIVPSFFNQFKFFIVFIPVAIVLFGTIYPFVLARVVGVLTEVPVMLILVKIVNNTKHWFKTLGEL